MPKNVWKWLGIGCGGLLLITAVGVFLISKFFWGVFTGDFASTKQREQEVMVYLQNKYHEEFQVQAQFSFEVGTYMIEAKPKTHPNDKFRVDFNAQDHVYTDTYAENSLDAESQVYFTTMAQKFFQEPFFIRSIVKTGDRLLQERVKGGTFGPLYQQYPEDVTPHLDMYLFYDPKTTSEAQVKQDLYNWVHEFQNQKVADLDLRFYVFDRSKFTEQDLPKLVEETGPIFEAHHVEQMIWRYWLFASSDELSTIHDEASFEKYRLPAGL